MLKRIFYIYYIAFEKAKSSCWNPKTRQGYAKDATSYIISFYRVVGLCVASVLINKSCNLNSNAIVLSIMFSFSTGTLIYFLVRKQLSEEMMQSIIVQYRGTLSYKTARLYYWLLFISVPITPVILTTS